MIALLAIAALLGAAGLAGAQDEDDPKVLFIRGADRSGGFLEAGNDEARTEQLADIDNESFDGGNHGWATFADVLRGEGFEVEQIAETAENASGPSEGQPVDLTALTLTDYAVIVLGSNNATYTAAQVDALDAYVRAGGGVLFISDANFGGSWQDAPNSDQQFLDEYGIVVHQDTGTYSIDDSDFVTPGHPILDGITEIDGEGVSPFDLGGATIDVTTLLAAEGQVRLNPGDAQGSTRAATADDAALWVSEVGSGRLAGHYDRNTFFNPGGAGTDITRFDNLDYALSLFTWLAGDGFTPPVDPSPTTPTTMPPDTVPPTGDAVGYWMGDAGGELYGFGDAPDPGAVPGRVVDSASTPDGSGLWILTADGVVHALAGATGFGDVDLSTLPDGEAPSTISVLPDGSGYWVFTNRGRALAFGAAGDIEDLVDLGIAPALNGPIIDSVATPTGGGVYMIGFDGGVFAIGDAEFHGSMGGQTLNGPVVGIALDPDGVGYWLVANDGGIFSFEAEFLGSMGGVPLNQPVVGAVPFGDGYLMVASDGGIFNFSNLPFLGSLGDDPPPDPVTTVTGFPT
ncbi:MAG: hypothetical protein AAGA99_02335 [Actinomycetota bacterium]